jgi:hypothetical protein
MPPFGEVNSPLHQIDPLPDFQRSARGGERPIIFFYGAEKAKCNPCLAKGFLCGLQNLMI